MLKWIFTLPTSEGIQQVACFPSSDISVLNSASGSPSTLIQAVKFPSFNMSYVYRRPEIQEYEEKEICSR